MPTTDGRLRSVTEPTAERKSPLDQLGIRLPDRLNSNRECNIDSASAWLIPQELSLSQPPRDKLQPRPARPQNSLAILIDIEPGPPGGQRSAGVLKNDPLFRAAALYRA